VTKALFEKLATGAPTFGVLELTPSPEMVEVCGYIGFDYVVIDRMVTSIDWGRASEMVRAGDAFGIATIIRAEADPWRASGNSGLATELTRALSVGADGICMSVASIEDTELAIDIGRDWHRRIYITRFATTETFRAEEQAAAAHTVVMPCIESVPAIDALERIIACRPTAVFLGMGDISRLLGAPQQLETDAVWSIIDRAARAADEHGVVLTVNTGVPFRTPEAIVDRTKRLLDHGVRSIVLQWTTQLFQNYCVDLLGRVRELA
jgi:4-hydroxy-2-oxoheptanedioate aldolase